MILLLEIIFMKLMRGVVRITDIMVNVSISAADMIRADNGMRVAITERPGLGDDGRLFPPYVNGVSQPFVVLYHDR